MSKKQANMFSSFGTAADEREKEQAQIQSIVLNKKTEPPNRKRGEGATTITLSISKDDKRRVKAYALQNYTTVSDLLHQWIDENCS